MVIVFGTVLLESPEEAARLHPSLAARAERSRADAGNLDYVFSSNIDNPAELRVMELWESEDALAAHLRLPDPAFDEALAGAAIVSARITACDGSGERLLMSR